MKKKTAISSKALAQKKVAKRVVATKRVVARRVVHGPSHDCQDCKVKYQSNWGKDRSMILLLAAGTIILVVVGMWMAGWL